MSEPDVALCWQDWFLLLFIVAAFVSALIVVLMGIRYVWEAIFGH